jgi:hypothetical protein
LWLINGLAGDDPGPLPSNEKKRPAQQDQTPYRYASDGNGAESVSVSVSELALALI